MSTDSFFELIQLKYAFPIANTTEIIINHDRVGYCKVSSMCYLEKCMTWRGSEGGVVVLVGSSEKKYPF